jgi:metal-dependent amidase/aminoacylase/carboxypeptidase family protein
VIVFQPDAKDHVIIYPHHYSKFDMDEDILPIETTLHVSGALKYLTSGQDNTGFIADK